MSRSLDEIRTAMQKLEERFDRGDISESMFAMRYQSLKEELAELQQTPLRINPTKIQIVKLSDGVNCRQLTTGDLLANHYRIMKELGRGGMGIVYQAEDINFSHRQRLVAIKVLPQHLSQISETLEDFKREFLTACQLVHQNICAMYEFGQDGDTYFLVIEYLEGSTLADILSRYQRYSLEAALPLIEQMAVGLDFAHSRGVLHLDMKPGNIMVMTNGHVKIMDFGLAQKLQPNTTHICLPKTFGTPLYLAPEQVLAGSRNVVRPSTDLWSLGVIVYEMLTGDTPFQGNTIVQLSHSIIHGNPKPILNIPSAAWSAITKALAKNSADRFASCHEFVEALSRFSDFSASSTGRLVTMTRPTPPPLPNLLKTSENDPTPASRAWLFVVFLMFMLGMIIGIWQNWTKLSAWIQGTPAITTPTVFSDPFEIADGQIPQALHQACWIEKENLWDFTVQEWNRLNTQQQGRYARMYQLWYATLKRQPLEREFMIQDISVTMRLIPPGRFWMGSPTTEPGRLEDEMLHKVTITQPFWMSKTEITQAQWLAIMKKNPSYFQNAGPNAPVERIDWDSARQFCQKTGMNLPTESQWEYACRAGTSGMSYLGDFEIISSHYAPKLGEMAWYSGNSGVNYPDGAPSHHWLQREIPCDYSGTHPVGLKTINPWGLYDLLGNVAEWCQDWHDKYPAEDQIDPQGAVNGITRIQRGGSWSHAAQSCRAATRRCSQRPDSIGVRLIKEFNLPENSPQKP